MPIAGVSPFFGKTASFIRRLSVDKESKELIDFVAKRHGLVSTSPPIFMGSFLDETTYLCEFDKRAVVLRISPDPSAYSDLIRLSLPTDPEILPFFLRVLHHGDINKEMYYVVTEYVLSLILSTCPQRVIITHVDHILNDFLSVEKCDHPFFECDNFDKFVKKQLECADSIVSVDSLYSSRVGGYLGFPLEKFRDIVSFAVKREFNFDTGEKPFVVPFYPNNILVSPYSLMHKFCRFDVCSKMSSHLALAFYKCNYFLSRTAKDERFWAKYISNEKDYSSAESFVILLLTVIRASHGVVLAAVNETPYLDWATKNIDFYYKYRGKLSAIINTEYMSVFDKIFMNKLLGI